MAATETNPREQNLSGLAIAETFVDELVQRASEIEENRFLPQDIAARMAEAGLYRLCNPESVGGLQRPAREYAEAVERLARADASAAWCVFIGITAGLTVASLERETAAEILKNPATITCGVFAPNGQARRAIVDGVEGFVVTGRWPWGSGSRNSQWFGGGTLVFDDDGNLEKHASGAPHYRTAVMPAADVEIIDTWDVSGLRGSGSNDFAVKDLFVPESHTLDRFNAPRPDAPIFKFPIFGNLGIGVASVALGLARAAIDEVLNFANQKTPMGSSRSLALKPRAQRDIAEAEATLRSARSYFYEVIDAAWDAALHEDEMPIALRRDLRLGTTHATKSAACVVDLMYSLGGGTSVYRKSPLQRYFRDVHVATQHAMVSDATMEVAGRLFLGLETDISQL